MLKVNNRNTRTSFKVNNIVDMEQVNVRWVFSAVIECFYCWLQTRIYILIDALLANLSILYPLKPTENLWFYSVLKGYKMRAFARNGLKITSTTKIFFAIK